MEVIKQGLMRKEKLQLELFGEARKAREMKEIGPLLDEKGIVGSWRCGLKVDIWYKVHVY